MALPQLPPNITAAAKFEESLWANGSVTEDSFYQVSPDKASASPGSLLKVERETNITSYHLPSATSLSRFIYQSRSLNGTAVPSSAFVLWPYMARKQHDGKVQMVIWAHGTSGLFANYAPSHYKNLYQHFLAPFTLALQGYAVVSPDYAGLGVDSVGENTILHEYLGHQAHANDIVYAAQAARQAFHQLSTEYVVIGHSQGGGAAWGVAQRQAQEPVEGYLGAIAVCPVTNMLELPSTVNPLIPLTVAYMTPAIKSIHPEFQPQDVFTPYGWKRWQEYMEYKHGIPVAVEMLVGFQLIKDDWKENEWIRKYVNSTANGGKPIEGPLLVIQGDEDPNTPESVTSAAVNKTREMFPDASIIYRRLPGVGHTPSMYASTQIWLSWIEERFNGAKTTKEQLNQTKSVNANPVNLHYYQGDTTWLLSGANAPYELA